MRVFVRADANARIGWGHLVRSGALARELGRSVTWLALDSDAAALGRLRERFRVLQLKRELGAGSLPFEASPGDWLIVDRYGWRGTEAMQRQGLQVLVVDDEARGRFEADLVVNPNAGAERLRYRTARHTRVLAGSRYALLRREFRAAPRRRRSFRGRSVLVSFGGSDPLGLSARVERILSGLGAEVVVVRGPSSSAATFGPRTRVVRAATASEMRRLMEAADAAVVSASSTWSELARLGVPSAVLACADNQKPLGRRLGALGLAEDLGWAARISDNVLASRLSAFLGDAAGRRRLSREARRAVDGRGVERVIEAMDA